MRENGKSSQEVVVEILKREDSGLYYFYGYGYMGYGRIWVFWRCIDIIYQGNGWKNKCFKLGISSFFGKNFKLERC